jgi:hypothetical protein
MAVGVCLDNVWIRVPRWHPVPVTLGKNDGVAKRDLPLDAEIMEEVGWAHMTARGSVTVPYSVKEEPMSWKVQMGSVGPPALGG